MHKTKKKKVPPHYLSGTVRRSQRTCCQDQPDDRRHSLERKHHCPQSDELQRQIANVTHSRRCVCVCVSRFIIIMRTAIQPLLSISDPHLSSEN